MSGFSHAYWYPDSSLAYSTKLVNRSLCLQDDRQIILVGSATHLEKNLKLKKDGDGSLVGCCDNKLKEKRCGCKNMGTPKESYAYLKRRCSSADIKIMDELPPPVVEKLKDITAKKKYCKMTLGKTYSTYSVNFSFRKVYPDLDFDCKFNRRIQSTVGDLTEEVVEKKRKPRPSSYIRTPSKLIGARKMPSSSISPIRRPRTSSRSTVVLRLIPDFAAIDVFDRLMSPKEPAAGKRKRFTNISKNLLNYQKTNNFVESLFSTGRSGSKQPTLPLMKIKEEVITKPIEIPAERIEEHKVFQAELRRQKRRSRKHTAVVEKKIEEPKIKTEEEKKSERDGILIKLCMANPKLSHVIHYHNKITKFGVKLDLETLLHGMLLPDDFRELQESCYEELLVLEAIEKAKRDLERIMAAKAEAAFV